LWVTAILVFSLRRCNILPLEPIAIEVRMSNGIDRLTAELGELLELSLPHRIDEDGLLLLLLVVQGEAIGLALAKHVPEVSRVQRRQDREEVLTAACPPDGVLIGEVVRHAIQFEAGLVKIDHGDLIILWRIANLDLVGLQKFFVVLEDLSEPSRGNHAVWGHVVLASMIEWLRKWAILTAAPSCMCRSSTCR
jgi:hypothetical protein